MKNVFLALTSLVITLSAQAEDLVIGKPSYGGTGCPQNSTFVVDNGTGHFMFLFDQYQITGADDKASFARTACNIRVPLSTPKGRKLIIRDFNTEGIYNVDGEDTLDVTQQVFFTTSPVRKSVKVDFNGSWDYVGLDGSSLNNIVAETSCSSSDTILGVSLVSLLKKAKTESTNSYVGIYKTEFQIEMVPCAE